MTLAYLCVLIAAMMPYLWVGIAKYPLRQFDNRAPRDYEARLTGYRQRAYWAQLNSLEAFPPFAAAVVIAHQLEAPQGGVDALALAFVALRIAYGLLYVADRPTLRSLAWTAGFACVFALFLIGA
jgi:uncharacterized MAPEG superfamily protein